MRAAPLLLLALLLAGCGAAAPTPTPAPQPTASGVVRAFLDAGLVALGEPGASALPGINQPGVHSFSAFRASRGGPVHYVVLFATEPEASSARLANTTTETAAFRRGRLILIWDRRETAAFDPYFTILQLEGR